MRAPDALSSVVRALKLGKMRAVEGFGEQPCWVVHVSGKQALRIWGHLRDARVETGFWPVIVGASWWSRDWRV